MASELFLDLTNLRDLEAVLGRDRVLRMVTTFLTDTSQRLSAVRTAVADRDCEALLRECHTLKGSAGNLGAHALAHTSQEMVDLIRHDQGPAAFDLLPRLVGDAEAVRGELARNYPESAKAMTLCP